jgi:hypothetical protein
MVTRWVEQQAEDGQTHATVIGPSRAKWDPNHIEAEAIWREAVRLSQVGDFVSLKTTKPANSIVVRFSIPDSPTGGGADATLGLYVNGRRVRSLSLTSRYSWTYGGTDYGDPKIDKPGASPHTFFDETRLLLDDIPAGAEPRTRPGLVSEGGGGAGATRWPRREQRVGGLLRHAAGQSGLVSERKPRAATT